MEKIIIAAYDEEQAIGKDGEIPWHYSEDLKHFKEKTLGHPVVMGRKTYFSLPENFRPLPGRENIVLSRSDPEIDESIKVVNSLSEAYEAASPAEKVFIIGGASVYRQALSDSDKMVLTLVPGTHDGDTFFPDWSRGDWIEVSRDERSELVFVELERRN